MKRLLLLALLGACAHPTLTTGMVVGAGVAANAALKIDRDPGGYVDRPLSIDKLAHAGVAYAITDVCRETGGHRLGCPALTLLGGVGFEVTQGHVSRLDIGADAVGALLAALVNR